MTKRDMTRRTVLMGASTVSLAGCDLQRYGLSYSTFKTALGNVVGLSEPPRVTLDEAAQIPFSTIGYRIGNAGEAILVLGAQSGSELIWTSAEHRTFSTVHGRIIKSSGFAWNLGEMIFPAGDPVGQGLQKPLPYGDVLSYCDYPDLSRFGIPFASRFRNSHSETISILGQPLKTIVVEEKRTCVAFNWDTYNRYWVDPENGFVWQSDQAIHPRLDRIWMEVLRAPLLTR